MRLAEALLFIALFLPINLAANKTHQFTIPFYFFIGLLCNLVDNYCLNLLITILCHLRTKKLGSQHLL